MTTAPSIEDVLEAIDQEAALRTLRALVKEESITGHEGPVADLVAAELRACGAEEVHQHEVEPGRRLVWSRHRGRGDGPTVMLIAHLDTVDLSDTPSDWTDDPRADQLAAAVVDGAVWGRGTADDKGGIATVLAALRTLNTLGVRPAGDVITLWVPDEESGVPGLGRSVGMRAAVESIVDGTIPRPDFAVYLEPTKLAVYTAQIGFLVANIGVRGRTAYFSEDQDGIDALRAAHPILSQVWRLDKRLRRRKHHRDLGAPRLLVWEMRAGGLVAVPGACDIRLIRIVLPSETLEKAADEIRAAVERGSRGRWWHPGRWLRGRTQAGVTVTFSDGRDHPLGGLPAVFAEGEPVRALRAAVRAVAPDVEVCGAARYWSELSFMVALGIACVYWAAGDIADCHSHLERLPLDRFYEAVAALTLLLAGSTAAA
jgi:acetylornithine deacetylase/succinyl-diaminopimelate desuccinylase-like protein